MTRRSTGAHWAFGAAAVGSIFVMGCAGASTEAPIGYATACRPVDGSLAAGASLADMAGSYRLTMARPGAADGASMTMGMLELSPRPGDMRMLQGTATPLQGVADIELEAVGAQRVGSLDSEDPASPGVLVMETGGTAPSVMLRFGSTANRSDRIAFDEAFTALTVLRIDDTGFAGTWRSAVRDVSANGYFCAVSGGG